MKYPGLSIYIKQQTESETGAFILTLFKPPFRTPFLYVLQSLFTVEPQSNQESPGIFKSLKIKILSDLTV